MISLACLLTGCGPQELSNEELISKLLSPNKDDRLSAAIAIGARGQRAAIAEKYLIEIVQKDDSSLVRQHAARALAWVNPESRQSVEVLRLALADSQLPVRRAAAEALGDLGSWAAPAAPTLVVILSEYWLGKTIFELASPSIPADRLEQHQLDRDKQLASLWELQLTAIDSLGRIASDTPGAIAGISRALEVPDMEGQVRTLTALSRFGSKALSARKQIEPLLSSPDSKVRRAAAECLGKVNARESIPLLAKLLVDPSSDVRKSAATALRAINTPTAKEHLAARVKLFIPSLKDKSWDVRKDAAAALEELGTDEAKEALKNHRRFFPD